MKMIDSQQEKQIRRNRQLKRLSYLELCSVPAILPTYLQLFNLQEFRDILISNAQTFFHLHNNSHLNQDPRRPQYQKFLSDCISKTIGSFMIKLLRDILQFAIQRSYPLQQIILKLDSNTDLHVTNLFKLALKSLIDHNTNVRIHGDYIASVLSLLELAVELNEVREGNSKFLFTSSNIKDKVDDSKEDYLKTKKIQQLEQLLVMLSLDMNQNYQSLSNFGFKLIKEYQFVMIQLKNFEKENEARQIPLDQIIDIQLQAERKEYEFDSEIFYNFNFQRNLEDKEKYLTKLCFECLKNMEALPYQYLTKTYNTISIAISDSFNSSYEDQEVDKVSQYKSNNYCLLFSLQILIKIKQESFVWSNLVDELQEAIKSLFQFKIPKLQKMWMILFSLIQVNLNNREHILRCISIFDWIIQYYKEKYHLEETEYIYGEYLILGKDILASLLDRKNGKEELKYKILEDIKKQLSKDYQKHQFQPFFQSINFNLLHHIVSLILQQDTVVRIKVQPEKSEQQKKSFQIILQSCQQRLNQTLNFLKNKKIEDSSKDISSEEEFNPIFEIILNVWLERLPKEFQCQDQWKIFSILLQFFKILQENNLHISLKREVMSHLTKKLGQHCLTLIQTQINSLLLTYTVPNKKTSIFSTGNQEIQTQQQLLEALQFLLASLFLILFSLDPQKNKTLFLHVIVINGYLNEDSLEELVRSTMENQSELEEPTFYTEDSQQILNYTPSFDVLSCFYDCIISKIKIDPSLPNLQEKYDKFCRQWCSHEQHYQWLSQQKMKKIRMISFKKYSEKVLWKVFSL